MTAFLLMLDEPDTSLTKPPSQLVERLDQPYGHFLGTFSRDAYLLTMTERAIGGQIGPIDITSLEATYLSRNGYRVRAFQHRTWPLKSVVTACLGS